jgi:tetratricopeptide (TPR) repeat protein
MSRSIHRTRGELEDLEHGDAVDSEKRARELTKLQNELLKKRRIKSQVRDLRRSSREPVPTSVEAIPIQECEASRHNHYPATPEDIRAVLRNLPSGISDGLEAVELRAGVEYQRELVVENELFQSEPDPLTGRQGLELMPGVFTPPLVGCYLPARNLIYLFAYVYDLGIANREIIEFYICLQMLSTFVHEVAHHFDCTSRVDRDRWRADDRDKCEIYAEDVQHDWLAKYVIPYLETSCVDQSAQLQRWLLTHVGTEVPLRLLAGDPRSTTRNGKIFTTTLFNTSGAFEDLVTAVAQKQPGDTIRIDFARNLHYAEEYDVPERILQSVLDENPKNADAIALTADIAEHRHDDSLAIELAERALAIDKGNRDALRVLTLVYERTSNWQRLFQSARRLLNERWDDMPDVIWALECCGRARFHQGRLDKFEMITAELESLHIRIAERSLKRLQALACE